MDLIAICLIVTKKMPSDGSFVALWMSELVPTGWALTANCYHYAVAVTTFALLNGFIFQGRNL